MAEAPTAEPPIARAPAGTFRGAALPGVKAWRGIRYAEPPTGELRWRAPVAPADVDPDEEGVFDALEFGPACPQSRTAAVPMHGDIRFDEDCLSLNVWAPEGHEDPLPVMVWLHGGAYLFGTGAQSLYGGAELAVDGVVVVTLNYRLGALGFLELTRCGEPGEFDGNLALRDILLALRWVQRNIATFGGDPSRVTLFGESAGGGLVTTLLATPSAEGLFHRAIAQSSPASSVYGEDRAFGVARRVLTEVGISAGDAGELRDVPLKEVMQAVLKVFGDVPAEAPGTIAFAPVVDGELVPESPVQVLREGRGLPVPLIIGTNKDEASMFKFLKSPLVPVSDARILGMLADIKEERPELAVPDIERVRTAYEGLRRQAVGLGIGRDIGFRLPALWIAEGHSEVAPTWLYRFDHATPILRLSGLGAIHASELPYVWRRIGDPSTELAFRLGGRRVAERISQRMSARWLAFAKGEDPDAAGMADAPDWPRYEPESRESLVIAERDRVVADLDAELREGWGDEVLAFP